MKPKRTVPYLLAAFGTLIAMVGAVFIVTYVWQAIVVRWGEPDQSLLFWYIPFLLVGIIGTMLGLSMVTWGIIRLRTIRRQVPGKQEAETRR